MAQWLLISTQINNFEQRSLNIGVIGDWMVAGTVTPHGRHFTIIQGLQHLAAFHFLLTDREDLSVRVFRLPDCSQQHISLENFHWSQKIFRRFRSYSAAVVRLKGV